MSTAVREQALERLPAASAPPVTRMVIAVLALAGLLLAAYMFMYKLGVIPTLACGEGGCDAVQNSPFAVFLGVPVPLLGIIGYGLILTLAIAGIQPRFIDDRRIALALLATCAIAAAYTLYLNYLEAFVIRAWCRWCIGSAIIVTALFLLSLAEIPRLRREAE
ncbi:MAG: vitamin K epoxide reductase family protein [Longimicrobiales bacterium]